MYPEIIRSRPKCKVEPYGLGRKNSLIGIAHRLQTFNIECERSTTWVNTGMEIIGVETRHIKELGINIENFFNPVFEENAPFGKIKNEQIPLETGIKRRSQENEEKSTLKACNIMNVSRPLDLLSNPIGKKSSNVSISDKLTTLMGSGNVQEINYSEIKCKLRGRRAGVVPYNRVVKLHKEIPTSSKKIRKISSQSTLRACNRPKPKLMATVMQRENKDTSNSGMESPKLKHKLIQAPLKKSTVITNINDFPDTTWVNKTSRQPVCGRKESIVNRCPSIKTNLKTHVSRKAIITNKIKRWEEKPSTGMAPLPYGMKRLYTLQDRYQLQNYKNFSQAFTAKPFKQSGILK